ncbi:PAAR domain-containing protein [Pseudomonas helleri]|uniref:PAAR domain-containing protein n=1 Tax=Pseudomonas helleri TaxID=1608996 RepID=UPI003119C7C1
MSAGYFIGLGDKTTCGGKVLEGDNRINIFGLPHACAGDGSRVARTEKRIRSSAAFRS